MSPFLQFRAHYFLSHRKWVPVTIQSSPFFSHFLWIWRLPILSLVGLFSWGSNLNSLISNRSNFYTPNHSALLLPDANISWNANCGGNTTLQLRPHSCQIEQKDYVMYLTEIISACTSPNSIWLFCKSVTLLIVLISEILSYIILHHRSFSADLLISKLFPEVILGVSNWMYKLLNSFGIFTLPTGGVSFQWLGIFCPNKYPVFSSIWLKDKFPTISLSIL